MPKLYTIGHSNHSSEDFLALLQRNGITAVADVRSHPYSRYLPHFNKKPLQAALLEVGIRYVFLGRELGARPSDLSCYLHGKAIYQRIAATELFARGIERLLQGSKSYQIALMCAEKDPINCHRTILVCRQFRQYNLAINHILSNGQLESHSDLEQRLLFIHKFTQPQQLSLFEPVPQFSRAELLEKAYQKQGDRIAYVDKEADKEDEGFD